MKRLGGSYRQEFERGGVDEVSPGWAPRKRQHNSSTASRGGHFVAVDLFCYIYSPVE